MLAIYILAIFQGARRLGIAAIVTCAETDGRARKTDEAKLESTGECAKGGRKTEGRGWERDGGSAANTLLHYAQLGR